MIAQIYLLRHSCSKTLKLIPDDIDLFYTIKRDVVSLDLVWISHLVESSIHIF